MQVSVEERSDLERCMTVQVPAEQVDGEIQSRLVSLSRRARIDGFRPGKVPVKVVKRMYGPQVRQEVLGELLQSSFQDAITQQNLRIAGSPTLEPVNLQEGHNLEYKATFEIFPEFEPNGIDGARIVRQTAEVQPEDIDKMLETLREQRTEWRDVERPSQLKDQVKITFEGKLNGEDFANNKGEEVPIVLGSGAMIPGFEDHLIGHTAGTETQFDITFPEDYPAAELANQQVNFSVKIDNVAEPVLPEINDEFIAGFGIKEGGTDALRQSLKDNMTRELAEKIKAKVKQQVMEKLLETNTIPVPQALVQEEIEQLAKESRLPPASDTEQDMSELKTKLFEEEAKRRVTLGLIVSRLVHHHAIEVDQSRVQAQLETMASSYEDSEEFIRWYRQNAEAMKGVQTLVLEDQVVEWLLERADVVEETVSFDDIMRPPQPEPVPSTSTESETQ